MNRRKWLLVMALVAVVAAYFALDLGRYLSLDAVKQRRADLAALYQAHPLHTIAVFLAVYVAVTALSLPGAAIMTLAAGAIFGLVAGTILVSFASSLGAVLAFLAARYLLRVLAQDPYDERAHLHLVTALATAGRHGEARRMYRAYCDRMADIAVEPTAFPETASRRPVGIEA